MKIEPRQTEANIQGAKIKGRVRGQFRLMVEAAGIEPASANGPQTALRAYPTYFCLIACLASRKADMRPVTLSRGGRRDSARIQPLKMALLSVARPSPVAG